MLRTLNRIVIAGTMAVLLTSLLAAQKSPEAGIIPSQIVSAKKIFISNTPGDDLYSDDPSQVYSAFYTAVKNWGHYELVSKPGDADLILEISFREPVVGVVVGNSAANVPAGGSYTNPHLRLVIVDPKTRVSLWWFIAHVKPPLFNSDKSLDRAIGDLMGQLKQITAKE
jgi:hypothetical protein